MNTTSDACLTLTADTPEATAEVARALAPLVGAGDTLLLHGPVGAGKTHFARALIQTRLAEVGRHEDVPSPSFTLVQTYAAGDLEIWHVDLYRLSHPDEVIELGLDEALASALCLIEWPDRLGAAPGGALDITLHDGPEEDARVVAFRGASERWSGVLAALRAAG